ncbi:MAG TPA: periplasmic heavy metal sensor [Prolixibacteraceae bacterium]|nr:periplasmic heavy metal sensor [Prolixibacteraceae bacterium]
MKAKILSLVLLMGLSIVVFAQKTENGPKNSMRGQDRPMMMRDGNRGPANGMNLTDAQKDAFKQSMIDMQKQIQPLRNELGEVKAHQKTLMTAEKTDVSAINKNIEKIGAIRVEMAKIQAKCHLDMRAQLTDDQKLKFDLMKGKMGHGNGFKGMKHGRGMRS